MFNCKIKIETHLLAGQSSASLNESLCIGFSLLPSLQQLNCLDEGLQRGHSTPCPNTSTPQPLLQQTYVIALEQGNGGLSDISMQYIKSQYIKCNSQCIHAHSFGILPNLHATTPAAHIFSQQQAVESWGRDEVSELVEGLLHQCWGQRLMGHSRMKSSQLPQHRCHSGSIAGHGPRVWAGSLSGCYQLCHGARQTWDGFTLQQSRDWVGGKQEIRQIQ